MSASTFLRRPGRGPRTVSDIEPGSEEQTGSGIVECLKVKGFCVIAGDVPEELVQQAAAAAPGVEGWTKPASLVQEGLLGEEGSSRIVELGMLEREEEPPLDDPLMGIDAKMWHYSNAIHRFQREMGMKCYGRTETLLHEANLPDYTDVDLSDEDAEKWMQAFLQHKIATFIFLGPGRGTLELVPIVDFLDADPVEVRTEPGLVVVVRCDQLSFNYFNKGADTAYIASSFLCDSDEPRKRKDQQVLSRAALELEQHILDRMQEIKDAEPEEPDWIDLAAPRTWVSAANRLYFKQQVISLCSASCRLPTTWDVGVFCISALFQGCDTVVEVPYNRWDHVQYFSEEPSAVNDPLPRTDCKHGAFTDGLELFDHKFFGISPAEVKAMDPCQRVSLEVTYEALHQVGYRKSMAQSFRCGMFVGLGTSEWEHAARSSGGSFGATGMAASICAGRLSFVLGCKGPSVALDTDQASSLTAAWWACESIQQKGKGQHQEVSCAIGVHLVLAHIVWLAKSQRGDFSRVGRCRNFDQGADGFAVADGVGCGTLKRRSEHVDGQEVIDESSIIGSIVGGASNNSGRGSALSAPHGSSVQEVIIDALMASMIMPSDVDIIECHGSAKTAGDYIEALASASALRNWIPEEQGPESVLCLGTNKTCLGNSIEQAGLSSLLKAMHNIRWGAIMANQHLRQLNRHLNMSDRRCEALCFATEHMQQGRSPHDSQVFVGVTAFGWGGTNVHIQIFGGIDETVRPPPEPLPDELKPRITFWPGGGGDLDRTSRPRRGYFIIGSFNDWAEGLPMQFEGEGCHSFVVELGENRWEQFQILIDNDPLKVLHPGEYKASRGSQVLGPEELDERNSTWLLDGRGDGGSEGGFFRHLAPGAPGDRYRIQLHVAGKWRTVSWSKLGGATQSSESEAVVRAGSTARYAVHSQWASFSEVDMQPDPSEPGRFTLDVPFTMSRQFYFFIVRNGDWSQAIFPCEPVADAHSPICGPDDMPAEDYQWCIRAVIGDTYRIEFTRIWQDGEDKMQLAWHRVQG